MSFDSKDLSVLAYSNGFTLWHYRCRGIFADAEAAGFFDGAANIFNPGDLLFTSADSGGGARSTSIYCVASVDGGRIGIGKI